MSSLSTRIWGAAARAGLTRERAGTIFTALLDQGFVSVGSFLLNVLLARYTLPADYGVFVLAYSVIAMANEVQQGVLLEPILVFAGGKRGTELQDYLNASLTIQILFALALVLLVWAGCAAWLMVRHAGPTVGTFAFMAFGLLGLQAREFTRKAQYARLQASQALWNDLVYLVVLLCGIILAVTLHRLTARLAFVLVAVAGVSSSIVGVTRAGIVPELRRASVAVALRLNWRYGRWMLATAATRWLTSEFYYVITALYLSAAAVAGLKAVQNMFAPVTFFLAGLSNLLLPIASRLATRPTALPLHRFAIGTGATLGPAIAAYTLAISLGASIAFRVLYGGRYQEFAYLIPLIGSIHIMVGLAQGPSIGLRALNRPGAVLWVSTLGAALSTSAAFLLAPRWGLRGVVWASLINVAMATPVWVGRYIHAARRHWAGPHGPAQDVTPSPVPPLPYPEGTEL